MQKLNKTHPIHLLENHNFDVNAILLLDAKNHLDDTECVEMNAPRGGDDGPFVFHGIPYHAAGTTAEDERSAARIAMNLPSTAVLKVTPVRHSALKNAGFVNCIYSPNATGAKNTFARVLCNTRGEIPIEFYGSVMLVRGC